MLPNAAARIVRACRAPARGRPVPRRADHPSHLTRGQTSVPPRSLPRTIVDIRAVHN